MDAQSPVVARGDHAVADCEGTRAAASELIVGEKARLAKLHAGRAVEVGDIGASVSDHQRLLVSLNGLPPVVDERGARGGGGGGGDHLIAFDVAAGECGDVSAAQLRQGVAVPRLVLPADVLERTAPS